MSNRPDTKKATIYCSLTQAEAAAIRQLTAMDVRVYFNQVITQKTVEWADIQDQF
jgi:mannose/fructose/N-acetylgalactosamine-specific phosphotransferase system component IIB